LADAAEHYADSVHGYDADMIEALRRACAVATGDSVRLSWMSPVGGGTNTACAFRSRPGSRSTRCLLAP
jgi:hypothetical protein